MKRFEKIKSFTFATLLTSASLHLIIYLAISFFKIEPPKVKPQTIEISVIDTKSPPIEKVKKHKKLKIQDVQVVEQNSKALNDETPEKDYFLSKNNQSVKKQTRAKDHGDFKNDAGKGQSGKSKVTKAKKKPIAHKKRENNSADGTKLKNFLPQHTYSTAKNFEVNEAESGQRSQSNDYLNGVEEGKQTILNTREFIYYAYYERIRGKIRKYWEPVIKDKVKHVFATGRKLASVDHQTAVVITLDGTGALVNVQVKDGSGVRDLDDAAIEAFKAAEPFPNPPSGIIENDGKIRINWNFVLEA